MPELYHEVNKVGTETLIRVAKNNGVENIIFSSTAATYGNPKTLPITEKTLQNPINPYGASKLEAEKVIINSGMKFTIFRYFNVAGSIGGGLGYFPKQKVSHLIPLINNVVNEIDKRTFKIFGDDYKTDDGTCVRDYVHVWDLASAHFLAAEKMLSENEYKSEIYNISSGDGFSVKEVYDAACEEHKLEIPLEINKRRQGDPDKLIASSEKLKKNLGWKMKYGLNEMIKSDFDARFNVNDKPKPITSDEAIWKCRGKKGLTFGTFDFLHKGHTNLIEKLIELSGNEENVVIAVSSDKWNFLKGKQSSHSTKERIEAIREKWPKAKIILEDHDTAEESWPDIYAKYDIDYIIMGGDHAKSLNYINNVIAPNGKLMKIIFYERTKGISSSIIRRKNNE